MAKTRRKCFVVEKPNFGAAEAQPTLRLFQQAHRGEGVGFRSGIPQAHALAGYWKNSRIRVKSGVLEDRHTLKAAIDTGALVLFETTAPTKATGPVVEIDVRSSDGFVEDFEDAKICGKKLLMDQSLKWQFAFLVDVVGLR